MVFRFSSLLLGGMMVIACSNGGISTATTEVIPSHAVSQNYPIARLPNGPHMGIIVGFDALVGGGYDRTARAEELLDIAANAGASISRIQVDWGDLEFAPGQFDEASLRDELEAAQTRNQFVFVTLSTLDSDGLTFPPDLLAPDGNLREGLELSSPEVLSRFEQFLDWFVPILSREQVWGLALGNEVDDIIREDRSLETGALVFFQAGRDRVKQMDPDIAVSVTLTISSLQTLPWFTNSLHEFLDISTINHYCLRADLTVTQLWQWDADVRTMKDTAGDLPIMIQELGCPVGYGDAGTGVAPRPNRNLGSPGIQKAYFEYFRTLFEEDTQFRAATVFQLYDWSPELARAFGDMTRVDPDMDPFADRVEEWLATVGLCRWADGTCRPAWNTWIETLKEQKSRREAAN